MLIRSDFEGDNDWIRIDGIERFYDYRIFLFHEDTDPLPAANASANLFDFSGELILDTRIDLNTAIRFQRLTGPTTFFVGARSFPVSPNDEGFFRFFARPDDLVGGTIGSSVPLSLNAGFSHASAIETSGDEDVYSFDFRERQTYIINLTGISSQATHLTTLGDPILRLFDARGNLLSGDDNSGDGTNSRLIYTPLRDERLFLRVLGGNGSTGSYRIESRQFDDFLSSPQTTGFVLPDSGPQQSVFEFPGDTDWFRVPLLRDHVYDFTGFDPQLYDAQGELLVGRGLSRYRATSTGDHFLSVFGGEFEVELGDDFPQTFRNAGFIDSQLLGVIERPGDRDRFVVVPVLYATYEFKVTGIRDNPLNAGGLAIRQNGELREVGGDTIRVTSDIRSLLYADVRAISANDTGVYRISVTPIDLAAGDQSTNSILSFDNSTATLKNAIETIDDRDFHRITLEQGTSYRISETGLDRLDIVFPNGVQFSTDTSSRDTIFYTAPVSGDYFISVEGSALSGYPSARLGGYTLTVEEGFQRPAFSGKFSWPNPRTSPATRELENINDITLQFGDEVEVYSTIPLTYDDGQTIIAAEQLTRISFEQWTSVVPVVEGISAGVGEVFSRVFRSNGLIGPWSNVLLVQRPFPTDIDNGFSNANATPYAFANGLPSYLENDPEFASFEPLSADERAVVINAVNSWARASSFRARKLLIAPGDNNDAAPTTIYKAALSSDQPVVGFRNGDGIGGDIILNTNSPVIADLSEGGQGFFEILRAIGITYGLQETDAVGRDESVLGSRTGPGLDFLPYPSTPLALDTLVVTPSFLRRHPDYQEGNTYSLTGSPFYFGIAETDHIRSFTPTTISAEGSNLPNVIDLRSGQSSFSQSGGERPHTIVNSYFTEISNGTGGQVNDFLFGNELANSLRGLEGNDVLIGGSGQDNLFGGVGDDIYITRPGYGDEFIDEESAGGVDVLRIEGLHNLDRLSEDISFERLGNDLLIRLEMDGLADRGGDSIQIRNFANPQARVEALTLLNPSGPVTRIDLPSLFSQLSSPSQRFRVTAQRGEFGQLVTPV